MGRWLLPILIAGAAALAVAVMGTTMTRLDAWYYALVQPRWAPPQSAYAIAWTVIYSLAALSGTSAWLAIPGRRESEWLVGLFALNGFLNILWSLLFFHYHRPDWAMVESIALWLSVAALIVFIWRRSIFAAILLVPYLMWVTLAGYLTMTIVRLNGPLS